MSDITPDTPERLPKHPYMTITNFNYEGSYLPGVICSIVIKADFGRSTPKLHHGIYIRDVLGSHFGFFKKRWEFSVISE